MPHGLFVPDDPTYAHFPGTSKSTEVKELILKSKNPMLPLLHGQTRRFCDREIAAKEWIIFLEDAFSRSLKKQTRIFEHELEGGGDPRRGRRATLLLAYHAKYRVATTRCCNWKTCFNCKRDMRSHTNGVCDEDLIVADCIVECRSCHVTMVKVEGCSAVTCWCGFQMDWDAKLQTRDRNKRQLIPVDIYDTKTYEAWAAWHRNLLYYVSVLLQKRRALRLSFIDEQLSNTQGLRTTLQRLSRGSAFGVDAFDERFPRWSKI